MSERFKNYTMNETIDMVDASYDNWITTKNEYDNTYLEPILNAICITFRIDIKHSDFKEEKQRIWFENFKDEEMVINKFKQEILSL